MLASLKSGVCPSCGSNEIYFSDYPRGERLFIAISSWQRFKVVTYICLACGHFEEHINPEDLHNQKLRDKVKDTWKKVK